MSDETDSSWSGHLESVFSTLPMSDLILHAAGVIAVKYYVDRFHSWVVGSGCCWFTL